MTLKALSVALTGLPEMIDELVAPEPEKSAEDPAERRAE